MPAVAREQVSVEQLGAGGLELNLGQPERLVDVGVAIEAEAVAVSRESEE
jgi:hypothetical protein